MEIRIPQEEGGSNIIRIEGPKEGLEAAKKELLDLASKMVRCLHATDKSNLFKFPAVKLLVRA